VVDHAQEDSKNQSTVQALSTVKRQEMHEQSYDYILMSILWKSQRINQLLSRVACI